MNNSFKGIKNIQKGKTYYRVLVYINNGVLDYYSLELHLKFLVKNVLYSDVKSIALLSLNNDNKISPLMVINDLRQMEVEFDNFISAIVTIVRHVNIENTKIIRIRIKTE